MNIKCIIQFRDKQGIVVHQYYLNLVIKLWQSIHIIVLNLILGVELKLLIK